MRINTFFASFRLEFNYALIRYKSLCVLLLMHVEL